MSVPLCLNQPSPPLAPHNVLHIRNGFELFDAVLSFKPDIILVEVDSPTRDTLEQLTTIREQAPRPVVMLPRSKLPVYRSRDTIWGFCLRN